MALRTSDAIDINKIQFSDGLYCNAAMINGNILHGYYKFWGIHSTGEIYIDKRWFKEGYLHNEFGPAYMFEDRSVKTWTYYRDGTRHRIDGPAFVKLYKYANETVKIYIYKDEEVTYKEWLALAWDEMSVKQKKKHVFNLGANA